MLLRVSTGLRGAREDAFRRRRRRREKKKLITFSVKRRGTKINCRCRPEETLWEPEEEII